MADIQNANPTILSPEDLPTRHRRSSSTSNRSSSASPSRISDNPFASPSLFSNNSTPFYDPFLPSTSSSAPTTPPAADLEKREEIDPQEIYDLISSISDPEHPLTLGSLAVVNLPDISIAPFSTRPGTERLRTVTVLLTPTITHCSMATIIGLGVRVRLEQCLPPRYRVDVRIKPGTHSDAGAVSKQLADMERVAAALENSSLRGMLNGMFRTCV